MVLTFDSLLVFTTFALTFFRMDTELRERGGFSTHPSVLNLPRTAQYPRGIRNGVAANKADPASGRRVWGEPSAARLLPEHHFQLHPSRGRLDEVRGLRPDPLGPQGQDGLGVSRRRERERGCNTCRCGVPGLDGWVHASPSFMEPFFFLLALFLLSYYPSIFNFLTATEEASRCEIC